MGAVARSAALGLARQSAMEDAGMNAHDAHEKIYETSTEHGKWRVAMLIAVLAVLLAQIEMTGRKAEQEALQSNIKASNL